jgi:hypothetical protein
MNNNIVLNLTIEKLNVILFSLSKMPYENVAELIEEVKSQAQLQLQKQQLQNQQESQKEVPKN